MTPTAAAPPLGQLLIERGLIATEDLERALELQRERRATRSARSWSTWATSPSAMCCPRSPNSWACRSRNSARPPSAPELEGLSPRFLRQFRIFPVAIDEGIAHAGHGGPARFRNHQRGPQLHRLEVSPNWPASRRFWTPSTAITAKADRQTARRSSATGDDEDLEHLRDMASEAPVIRLVNAMIAQAVEKRASDIHIEPFEKEFRIRYRVDGVLFNQEQPPRELKAAIISRVKLMAKLNIAERRLPQDGRIKIKTLGREVDLRVSTLPTLYGESVVMRLLDRSAGDFYDLRRWASTSTC